MKQKNSFPHIIIMMLVGAAGGFLGALYMIDTPTSWVNIIIAVGTLILSFIFHLIIHEFGHLLFGKATGYQVLSFRVFSHMWVKNSDKIEYKRLSVPGTLGQCLMIPPEKKDGNFPFKLYLLGGGLMNIFASVLVLGVTLSLDFRSIHILAFVMAGLLAAGLNLTPFSFNDGMMLKNSIKKVEVRQFLYNQLKVNSLTSTGTAYLELPQELIEKPELLNYQDLFHIWVMLVHYNRALEGQRFIEAREIIDEVWTNIDKTNFYRQEVAKEWMFIHLYLNEQLEVVENMWKQKELQVSISAKMISHSRLKAMFAWRMEGNEEKASQFFAEAIEYGKRHPNEGDAQMEYNLIKHCQQQLKERQHA
ncbi:hypothetical protein [Alkalihalobacillus pseudalcaliphilus]|uniref:hypothetical protein n=1 Tax=Alkalihalobacillus pseudalcaliphilus TaxID=79884 RepID=UPI00069CE1FB|nr:hypothetical protein [Alkalihalobacillus pseudalcaliphilus]